MSRATRARWISLLLILVPGGRLCGQDSLGTRDSARASRWSVSSGERTSLLAFGASSLALLPFDARLAQRTAMNPARPGTTGHLATAVAQLGDPGTVLIAGAALVLGRLAQQPALADIGLHAGEALIVSGSLTQLGKLAIGRGRPRAVGLDHPFAFTPLRGGAGHVSFPSGHTSAAFTVAAVMDRELHRAAFGARHHRLAVAASAGLYAAASAVGAARMVQRAHWSSDVMAGAGLGLASGWWTVRQRHAGPRARVERWIVGAP